MGVGINVAACTESRCEGQFMGMFNEIRLRSVRLIGPVAGLCSIVYFGFHIVNGDRGLQAYWHLKTIISETRPMVELTHKQRLRLERQVYLLRPDSLDLDMLDERARVMLNYVNPNDMVIFYGDSISVDIPAKP